MKEQAEGIMQAMRSMHYSAIGIAPQDLGGGVEFLEMLQKKYTVPFVSANLIRRDNGSSVFKPFIVQQAGSISVAVLGLTGNFPGENKDLPEIVSILPWQEALRKTLPGLVGRADMIILLSSYPEQTNREIAQQFNEINLILQSGHAKGNQPPQHFANSLMTQTADRGMYVGRMDINWTAAKKWSQDFSPILKATQDRLDRINWRLGRLTKKLQGERLEENVQYQKLQREKLSLIEEIQNLKEREQPASAILSTYRYQAVPLKKNLPDDPGVSAIVAATKKRVYEKNKQRLEELRRKSSRPVIPASLAGWESCRTCHRVQTEFWQKTDHAKAWDTLARKRQQLNQGCLICHVTLSTYDRDVVTRDNLLDALTPAFQGVGCEACHGPAAQHITQPEQNRPVRPTATICTTCHTPERDDNFNFTEKMKIIRCPSSVMLQ
jgi:hypothetical protein